MTLRELVMRMRVWNFSGSGGRLEVSVGEFGWQLSAEREPSKAKSMKRESRIGVIFFCCCLVLVKFEFSNLFFLLPFVISLLKLDFICFLFCMSHDFETIFQL